jgi:Tol biopolymer transport system component/imidazolonepropionase-like amidohydrolase
MGRLLSLAVLLILCSFSQGVSARTVEFETMRVTTPDIALAPGGQTLVFSMLGHLFRLPSAGGTAEQLTFGPCYDNQPVFSPDGSQIAFTSDRDGSDGNIFVLHLSDGQLLQLTQEEHAGLPTWTPDGKSIIYLRYDISARRRPSAVVSRISAQGGKPEALTAPSKIIGSTFFLPDGRLAWSVVEQDNTSSNYVTNIEVVDSKGTASTLRTIPGFVDRVLSNPSGDGLYCHRTTGTGGWIPIAEDIVFVSLPTGPEKDVLPVSSLGRFALSQNGKSLFVGDLGRLWRVQLPAGAQEALPLNAHVKLEVQEGTPALKSVPNAATSVRAILSPRVSPDGRTLVFGAVGVLWRQSLDGGNAQRISPNEAPNSEPTFSPDGRQLAFVQNQEGKDSILLLDLATGQIRLLTSAASISELAWSADGKRVTAVVAVGFDQKIVAYSVTDGKSEPLADAGFWSPRPQLSADGHWLYYSSDSTGVGNFYRVALSKDAKPEQISHLSRNLSDARISPDGKWLVFRRNRCILAASLADKPIQDRDVREISSQGGDTFAFTPDGSSVIYSVGRQVWRQSLSGAPRQEIPIRLEISRPVPPPLLLRAVRVLDFASGGFGPETSLMLENGRIQWIGSESRHQLPAGTTVVEAKGRFAIPGLFDVHVHAVGANEEAFLAYGITSLRDTGGGLASLNALQDRSDLTRNPTPRYFYSGEIFEGEHPYWGDSFLQIDNEDDARDYVQQFQRAGASFIKVYPSLPWKLKRVVAGEAHQLGLPVVGHGMSLEEITKSTTLGFFSLEHTPLPNDEYDDVLQMLASSGTRWDPTLAVDGADSLLIRDDPNVLADPKFLAFTPESQIEFALNAGYYRGISTDALRGGVSAELVDLARAHKLGVKLLVGTDAPNPECFYGSSLHWELARFVDAGLPPIEVLRLATQGGAFAVGAEELGAIAPGNLADLVLLEANPVENIRNTETIWRVFKGGLMFDPDKLQKIPHGLSAASAKVE